MTKASNQDCRANTLTLKPTDRHESASRAVKIATKAVAVIYQAIKRTIEMAPQQRCTEDWRFDWQASEVGFML